MTFILWHFVLKFYIKILFLNNIVHRNNRNKIVCNFIELSRYYGCNIGTYFDGFKKLIAVWMKLEHSTVEPSI